MVSHRKPAHLSEPTGLAPSGVLRAKQAPSGSKTALRSGARALGKPCQGGKQRQHCRWPPCGLGPALPTRLVLSAPGPAHSSAWARGKDHPCGGFHCEAQLFGLSTSSEEWSGHGVQLGPQGLSSLPWSLNVMTRLPVGTRGAVVTQLTSVAGANSRPGESGGRDVRRQGRGEVLTAVPPHKPLC